jgi:hypothetical protein
VHNCPKLQCVGATGSSRPGTIKASRSALSRLASTLTARLSTVRVDTQSAIVFDDPVSSLDHLHRDRVAARLAEAGQTRQVIVFTHDMAFLLLLDEACRATKDREATPVAYRLISRGTENAGYCHQDPPANVMPLDKVIDGMKAHLANVKIHHERGDQAKWLREVTSFQDQLRTTWERAVEEVIGPVIRRLSRKVDTTGLIKLTFSRRPIAPRCAMRSAVVRHCSTVSPERSIPACPRRQRSKVRSKRWRSGSVTSEPARKRRHDVHSSTPSTLPGRLR